VRLRTADILWTGRDTNPALARDVALAMIGPAMSERNTGEQAACLSTNPAAFFGYSTAAMDGIELERLDALQLAAAQSRFRDLRDRVPVLTQLVDDHNVQAIGHLDDLVPLLFPHTVYKAYPVSLLENNRFQAITAWLDRLTTHDLSAIDVSGCTSIDSWIETMDAKSPVEITHSSGTSGTMSFLPRGKGEADKAFAITVMNQFQTAPGEPVGAGSFPVTHVVHPTFRSGSTGILRWADLNFRHLARGDERRFHALYPERMSSDLMFFAARVHAAAAKGELDRLERNSAMRQRRRELIQMRNAMAADAPRFFERIIGRLRGERVFIMGSWTALHDVAEIALARGLEGLFAADSVVATGGGAKGQVVPDDWEERVRRVFGVDRLVHSYGMSEVMAFHQLCEHGRYHLQPTVIPFVLDPDTGLPLPRRGEQTGRAAFFDLLAESYWGGLVTGDEVTVEWERRCACGRRSRHLARSIERYSEKRGGDDKISCAAVADASSEALEYLESLPQ